MSVNSNDLGSKLLKKLGIPGDVKALSINFKADKQVTITAEIGITDRMGRVIDSVFEGYTVEKKDKEPEKEIVNALDAYDAEQRQLSALRVANKTMIPCSLNSGHTPHVQGSECPECRETRQSRLNNLI